MCRRARRPDGRCCWCKPGVEESPGSTGIRCRLTAGGGDPRDSATENKPPAQGLATPRARAKRCGKSAPRPWQQGRQGKPHREQDRIGAAASQDAGAFPLRRPGWSREACREARPRGMVVPWVRVRTHGQNPAYRPSGSISGLRPGPHEGRCPSPPPRATALGTGSLAFVTQGHPDLSRSEWPWVTNANKIAFQRKRLWWGSRGKAPGRCPGRKPRLAPIPDINSNSPENKARTSVQFSRVDRFHPTRAINL